MIGNNIFDVVWYIYEWCDSVTFIHTYLLGIDVNLTLWTVMTLWVRVLITILIVKLILNLTYGD